MLIFWHSAKNMAFMCSFFNISKQNLAVTRVEMALGGGNALPKHASPEAACLIVRHFTIW